MALQTHSPSHSLNTKNNKYGHGVFGDVYTIIKDMQADHQNSTFDFQFRLPPVTVTYPPLFPSPLSMPTFCLF